MAYRDKPPNPNRQHMNKYGAKPKVRYLTELAATDHAIFMSKRYKQQYDVYVCQVCWYYHIGRHSNKNQELVYIMQGFRRREETLAGKLVFALRGVLDHEPL